MRRTVSECGCECCCVAAFVAVPVCAAVIFQLKILRAQQQEDRGGEWVLGAMEPPLTGVAMRLVGATKRKPLNKLCSLHTFGHCEREM